MTNIAHFKIHDLTNHIYLTYLKPSSEQFLKQKKDFLRQQIDVKRQCFHVNDLKIYFSEKV